VLLEDSNVRGVLVGDPDQAIYEFNGARPDLFGGFEGLQVLVLCPWPTVVDVRQPLQGPPLSLKDSGGAIGTR